MRLAKERTSSVDGATPNQDIQRTMSRWKGAHHGTRNSCVLLCCTINSSPLQYMLSPPFPFLSALWPCFCFFYSTQFVALPRSQ